MHGNVPRIMSAGEQMQAETMKKQARAQAKLQMSGEFVSKMLEAGAYVTLTPESLANYAMETAENVLTKFSLDNQLSNEEMKQ